MFFFVQVIFRQGDPGVPETVRGIHGEDYGTKRVRVKPELYNKLQKG